MIKHTKVNLDIDVKVYLREKKGYYYAVLIYKNVAGVRREKWIPTKLITISDILVHRYCSTKVKLTV